MRTIYHVVIKNKPDYKKHYYFGSISAIFENEEIKNLINVSIHTLYKFDFNTYNDYYNNAQCNIFKGVDFY